MATNLSPEHQACITRAVARAVANELPPSWVMISMTMGTSPEALDTAVDTAILLNFLVEKAYNGKKK
jgi:hypothetical protein